MPTFVVVVEIDGPGEPDFRFDADDVSRDDLSTRRAHLFTECKNRRCHRHGMVTTQRARDIVVVEGV